MCIRDRFNNVGKLGSAADGSDFARTLSVIRSRAIYVMLAVQSLGQLQNLSLIHIYTRRIRNVRNLAKITSDSSRMWEIGKR